MTNFGLEFKKLNKAQKEAVKAIDGPVLVVAGPGTGKTQLLALRVAYILRTTNTDPKRVLCLTFTNKAAMNMQSRLFDLIGDESRHVQVKTFHSFAAELINQYPDYFWRGGRLQIAPEAVQARIVQTILKELPADNPLAARFAGRFTALGDVNQALQLAKEAGLTPEKLAAITRANLAYIKDIEKRMVDALSLVLSIKTLDKLQKVIHSLPEQGIGELTSPFENLDTVIKDSLADAISKDYDSGKTKHVGEWKARWIQTIDGKKGMFSERRRNEWWLALSGVYESYRNLMHERGHYDYADMIVEVLSQLDKNADLLSEVQNHYDYLLIDEFQDSNAAQLRLAHIVADRQESKGRPNIMAVGDDDQSIFGFNGAELGTMLFFDRSYESVVKIVLTDNYRSSQEILNVSEKIISQAEDRLVNHDRNLRKKLIAANPPKKPGEVRHLAFPSQQHQYSHVARKILKSYSNQESMAVLARGHVSLRQFASLLLGLGVPIKYEQQNNILDYDGIRQIVILSRLIISLNKGDARQVNHLLSETLRHPMWGIKSEKLWQIALDNYNQPDWLKSLKASEDKNIKAIYDWLTWLSSISSHQPLPLVMEFLIGLRSGSHMNSPVRDYFANSASINSDYLQALSGIRLLRELVNEFSDNSFVRLQDFVNLIDTVDQANQVITDASPFVTSDNAVELYTVHKAKGLEFDSVYLIDAIDNNWRPRYARRLPPANLPLERPGEHLDDYVRLLYVSTTRARRDLCISSYHTDTASNDVMPTPLLNSALPFESITSEKLEKPTIVLEENLRWPRLNSNDEKQLLKGRVENFSINVTNLLNFLDLTRGGPQYFLERSILRLPEAKSPSLALGTAIHAALDAAQGLQNSNKFSIAKVLKSFVKSLENEHLSDNDKKEILGRGRAILTGLFKDLKYELPTGSASEQTISNVKLKNAIIGGKLDRVDKSTDKISIIDYKTGSPLSSLTSKSKSLELKAYKHRTQLIFYALLSRYQPGLSGFSKVEGQMVYVQAKSKSQLIKTYGPTDEEIDRLEKLIEAVWKKVKAMDLPDVSKYSPDLSGVLAFENDLIYDKI